MSRAQAIRFSKCNGGFVVNVEHPDMTRVPDAKRYGVALTVDEHNLWQVNRKSGDRAWRTFDCAGKIVVF